MKALGAAGSAAALALLCLTGAGGAAAASPAQVGHTAAASLKVPVSFQPATASFVTPAWGAVLGGSGCAISRPCPAQLAVTADGGARWSLMRAPTVSLSQVSQVLFANHADGWLYDQYYNGHIWVTHNGGASWRGVTLPGRIETMAASTHAVYAVVGNALYRSPLGSNAWVRVNPRTRYGPMTGSTLAVWGNSVWFATSTYLWTTADGTHWARYALHSPGTLYGQSYKLTAITAASPRDTAFLWSIAEGMFHSSMKVLVSYNGGQTQRQAPNSPPNEGDVAAFAVTPGRFGVISIAVVTPGLDNIYRSADLGKTWTTVGIPGTSGGAMLNSLEFMSPTAGCLVAGDPASGITSHLMWTANAGRTWYAIRF
jgi:hypothetical protein